MFFSNVLITNHCHFLKSLRKYFQGSKVVTLRGKVAIEELKIGDQVQTIYNGNLKMTQFLGWIHKEVDHVEHFVILKTGSAKITVSKKHVIFRQVEGSHDGAMTTTFADATRNIHRKRWSGGVEIETLFQFYNYDSLRTSVQANVTRLYPYPSSSGNTNRSQLGYVDISFDE